MINKLVAEIKGVINSSRNEAIRSVNFARVLMYHNIGRIIVTELQDNNERADYGSSLLKNISDSITPEFGSGFSVRILELTRRFYTTFPNSNALHSNLSWTQKENTLNTEFHRGLRGVSPSLNASRDAGVPSEGRGEIFFALLKTPPRPGNTRTPLRGRGIKHPVSEIHCHPSFYRAFSTKEGS